MAGSCLPGHKYVLTYYCVFKTFFTPERRLMIIIIIIGVLPPTMYHYVLRYMYYCVFEWSNIFLTIKNLFLAAYYSHNNYAECLDTGLCAFSTNSLTSRGVSIFSNIPTCMRTYLGGGGAYYINGPKFLATIALTNIPCLHTAQTT